MELTPKQRVDKVKELSNMDHLNAEEKEIVGKILAENADVFHIPGNFYHLQMCFIIEFLLLMRYQLLLECIVFRLF